jgi:hypothetical protein
MNSRARLAFELSTHRSGHVRPERQVDGLVLGSPLREDAHAAQRHFLRENSLKASLDEADPAMPQMFDNGPTWT